MWDNGELVSLSNILEKIPTNQYSWIFGYYEGLGGGVRGMNIVEFEQQVREYQPAVVLSWGELLEFAAAQWQTINANIVAVDATKFVRQPTCRDLLRGRRVCIQAWDSTSWRLGLPGD